MNQSDVPRNRTLEEFRSSLLLLARLQLDGGLQNRIDASDIVQQTLLEAHAKADQFHGDDSGLAAWLRQALVNNLRDAWRALRKGKRDIRREQSLQEAVEQSSARLEAMLTSPKSSPSQRAVRNEELLRLADALVQLPEAQREAIVLHHLQGCPLAKTARALGKEPERRYESAAALADDLERWLRGEPIVARPVPTTERLIKWARRRPAAAALVVVSIAAAAVMFVGEVVFNAQLQVLLGDVAAKQTALDKANQDAECDRLRAKGLLLAAHATTALPTNPTLALLLGIEGAKRNPSLASNNALGILQPRIPNHKKPAYGNHFADLQFNADGSRVLATSRERKVYLFDADTGQEFLAEDTRHLPLFSPNGRLAVTLTTRGKDAGTIWDAVTGKYLLPLKPSQPQANDDYGAVAFSPNLACVLIVCPDHTVRIWNAIHGREMTVFRGHTTKITDAVFSPDGRKVLTTADDLTPRMWEAGTGKELLILKGHEAGLLERQRGVWGGAFSPHGKHIVTCGKEGIGRFWDATSGEQLASWNGLEPINWSSGFQFKAYFTPDGRWVLTERSDGTCRLWPTDPLSLALAKKPRDLTPAEKQRFEAELRP